jgi:hypothetical protein
VRPAPLQGADASSILVGVTIFTVCRVLFRKILFSTPMNATWIITFVQCTDMGSASDPRVTNVATFAVDFLN